MQNEPPVLIRRFNAAGPTPRDEVRPMDDAIVLQELETLAQELEVEVRYDDLDSDGGLCKYKGKSYLFVNRALSVPDRIGVLGRGLAAFPLEQLFIRPQVRKILQRYGVGLAADGS